MRWEARPFRPQTRVVVAGTWVFGSAECPGAGGRLFARRAKQVARSLPARGACRRPPTTFWSIVPVRSTAPSLSVRVTSRPDVDSLRFSSVVLFRSKNILVAEHVLYQVPSRRVDLVVGLGAGVVVGVVGLSAGAALCMWDAPPPPPPPSSPLRSSRTT